MTAQTQRWDSEGGANLEGPATDTPGQVPDPAGQDPDAGIIDPPPGQEELPAGGTTVGAHESAPEEIGESG